MYFSLCPGGGKSRSLRTPRGVPTLLGVSTSVPISDIVSSLAWLLEPDAKIAFSASAACHPRSVIVTLSECIPTRNSILKLLFNMRYHLKLKKINDITEKSRTCRAASKSPSCLDRRSLSSESSDLVCSSERNESRSPASSSITCVSLFSFKRSSSASCKWEPQEYHKYIAIHIFSHKGLAIDLMV